MAQGKRREYRGRALIGHETPSLLTSVAFMMAAEVIPFSDGIEVKRLKIKN